MRNFFSTSSSDSVLNLLTLIILKVNELMKESVTISSTAFYNHIAEDYNAQMNQDPHNERIRTETAGYLKSILRQGVVLDFGGGTGLDLPWLLQHNYKVIFCEPAPNMR